MSSCKDRLCLMPKFYDSCLPGISVPSSNALQPHNSSTALLKDTSPWLLSRYTLGDVGADGNSFFARYLMLYMAVSIIIVTFTVSLIDILLNPAIYDNSSLDFYAPYASDDWLPLLSYDSFAKSMSHDGAYSDMLAVLE